MLHQEEAHSDSIISVCQLVNKIQVCSKRYSSEITNNILYVERCTLG